MKLLLAVFAVCYGVGSASAQAALYSQTITTIFPNFNEVGDSGWTRSAGNGLNVALRARLLNTDIPFHLRTPSEKEVYSFEGGVPVFVPDVPTAEWAFDVHVDSGNLPLASYDFYLQVGVYTGPGISYFPPMSLAQFENAYGTRSTGNGGGVVGWNLGQYYSVAQRSFNIAKPPFSVSSADGSFDGIYVINLFAVAKQAGTQARKSTAVGIIVADGYEF